MPAISKLDWFPMYVQRIKASGAWNLPDYQFGWYLKLIIESVDSPIPGYLPGSTDKLWRLAGAKSQSYFEKWGGCELVSRLFCRTEIEGQAWIYNKRILQVIHEQNTKLTKRRRKHISSLSLSVQDSLSKESEEVMSVSLLPEWVPKEAWENYLEMRRKKRATPTEHAKELLVKKLDFLRNLGFDPEQVLNQSTMNNYTGIFEVKEVTNGHKIEQAGKCKIHPDSGTGPNGQCWGCYNESPADTLERIRANAARVAAGQ